MPRAAAVALAAAVAAAVVAVVVAVGGMAGAVDSEVGAMGAALHTKRFRTRDRLGLWMAFGTRVPRFHTAMC